MIENRKEQVEAINTMREYNAKLLKALKEISCELKGERKEDTAEYLDHILRGANWEFQVINGVIEVLNEEKENISKDDINEMIAEINVAYLSKEDAKLADLIEEKLIIFFENLHNIMENIAE